MADTKLNANQVFIICAEADKDYVLAIQRNLKERNIKVWSMFKEDGNYSVGIGEDHLQVAIEEIKNACVALLLISEESIKKGTNEDSFIFQEINNFYNLASNCKNFEMKLIPIYIGADFLNRIPAKWMPFGINSYKISTMLTKKTTQNGDVVDELKLNNICNEISKIYYSTMNNNYRYILENKYNLVVLGNKLMQSEKTVVKTVSDDIRQADENDCDSLKAIHIITNEISEYDCNAYSLMIISSNLLGKLDKGCYDPERYGVKYYYYCPQKYLERIEEDYKNRIISFLRRDEDAITYAENSIRAHYATSKNLISYLINVFYNKKISHLLLGFSIPNTEKKAFLEEIEEYDGIFYDSDAETIDLPSSFFEWLRGRNVKFNHKAFEFINKVTEFFNNTKEHNQAMVDELICVNKMLGLIQCFHNYLHDKKDGIPHNKFVSVAKKLIGLNNDQNNTLIERWIIDRERTEEWENQDVYDIVSRAMANVKFVPIKDSDDFVICNSFGIYDHKDRMTGKRKQQLVWYSTAHNFVQTAEKVSANDEQEMLVIFNENTTDTDCNVVKNTLKYLKDTGLIAEYYEF